MHVFKNLRSSVSYILFVVAMNTHLHVASSLFNNFLPHFNSLKYIGAFMIELSLTKGDSFLVSFFVYFTLHVLTLIWPLFGSLFSKEHALMITLFDFLLSV